MVVSICYLHFLLALQFVPLGMVNLFQTLPSDLPWLNKCFVVLYKLLLIIFKFGIVILLLHGCMAPFISFWTGISHSYLPPPLCSSSKDWLFTLKRSLLCLTYPNFTYTSLLSHQHWSHTIFFFTSYVPWTFNSSCFLSSVTYWLWWNLTQDPLLPSDRTVFLLDFHCLFAICWLLHYFLSFAYHCLMVHLSHSSMVVALINIKGGNQPRYPCFQTLDLLYWAHAHHRSLICMLYVMCFLSSHRLSFVSLFFRDLCTGVVLPNWMHLPLSFGY